MNNLNIVELIVKNPITKLNTTYNNKLLEKIKKSFTQDEQQLFITSFYCYLNYDDLNDYIIDLDDIWTWLGFSQKDSAKRLLTKNFTEKTDYKILECQSVQSKKEKRGGHNKEIIKLNIDTFKSFCLLTSTTKANEVRKYYIKLEKMLQETLVEQTKEFANEIKTLNIKIVKDKLLERHNVLYDKFSSSGSLVYFCRVHSYEDNTWVIKIGCSGKGIKDRADEHKSKFTECMIYDCFQVQRFKEFETFLHSHPEIKNNLVTNLKGHENERELFLIGDKLSYNRLLQIANDNIKNYLDNSTNLHIELDKIKAENENLKLVNNMKQSDNIFLKELLELNKKLFEKVENLEKSNKEINEKLNSIQVKNTITTNFGEVSKTTGPRLQQINPETLKLVKTWDCMAEALKADPKLKRASIGKAVSDNTVYHGFRWIFVDRELDPNKIHKLEPTKETRTQNNGYIAKLNKDKTRILNVYLDRKTACKFNDYKSDSALDNPVKNFTESNGHYYILYDSCDKALKQQFEKSNGKPILYKSGIGQYDKSNKLIGEFSSKQECCQSVGIGDKSLKKSLEKNIAYNDFTYKYLDAKLKVF
jgi:phage anti-repressor protein